MTLEAIQVRLRGWLAEQYRAVIFEQPNAVGYALYRPCDPDSEGSGVYIRQFHIDRQCRRQGLGTTAFRRLVETRFQGQRITLETLESNPTGHRFWQSLGFDVYSTRYEIPRDGGDT